MPAFVYVRQDATVLSKGSPFMGEEVEGTTFFANMQIFVWFFEESTPIRHLLCILPTSNPHVFSIFPASFRLPNAGDSRVIHGWFTGYSGIIRKLFGNYSTGATARTAEEMAPVISSMTVGLSLSPFRLQRYKKILIYANFWKVKSENVLFIP